jgi:hypothetical protein
MLKLAILPMLAGLVLVGLSPARAESPSELLEKGIYTEQTVGDLDAAMAIYKKIVAQEKENRPAAAKALLRLGLCQLKKGDNAEATKTFEDLVKRFPDQKDQVTQAREHLEPALKLEPVPWADGEVLDMVLKMGGGEELGKCVYTASVKDLKGRKTWQVGNRLSIAGGASQTVSRVDVDFETFRPIHGWWDVAVIGSFDATYAPDEVTINSKVQGKSSVRKIPLDKVVYDNEQAVHLFRRLPLAVGYKTTVPIFVSLSTAELPLWVEVTKKEKIKVPAGEFECFRLDLSVGQLFWVSADAHRYLVKFEAGGFSAELAAINPPKPNEFSDAELGASLAAPAGWYFYKCPKLQKPGKLVVDILEPDAKAVVSLTAEKLDHLKAEEKANVRALADLQLVLLKKQFKQCVVRPDSWMPREISGRPAVAFTADYVQTGRKMVAYVTTVLGEATGAVVLVTIPADEFDAFKKTIDPIIDSCKVK